MKSISLRGCETVDFYILDVEPDNEIKIRREVKYCGSIRTLTRTVENFKENGESEVTEHSISQNPRIYTSNVIKKLLKTCSFDSIEISLENFLDHILEYHGSPVHSLSIPNSIRGLEAAYSIQPSRLIVNPSDQHISMVVEYIDLKKLPHLQTLHLYDSKVNFQELLCSNIRNFQTYSGNMKVTVKMVDNLIMMFETGNTSCESLRILLSPFENEHSEIGEFLQYNITNPRGRKAVLELHNNQLYFDVVKM